MRRKICITQRRVNALSSFPKDSNSSPAKVNGESFTNYETGSIKYIGVFSEERSDLSEDLTIEEANMLNNERADFYRSLDVPESRIHPNGYYNFKKDDEENGRSWANIWIELDDNLVTDIWMTSGSGRVYNVTFIDVPEDTAARVLMSLTPDEVGGTAAGNDDSQYSGETAANNDGSVKTAGSHSERMRDHVISPSGYPFEIYFSEEEYNVFIRDSLEETPLSFERAGLTTEQMQSAFEADENKNILACFFPKGSTAADKNYWGYIYVYPYPYHIPQGDDTFRKLLESGDPMMDEFMENKGFGNLDGTEFYQNSQATYVHEYDRIDLANQLMGEIYSTVWGDYAIVISCGGSFEASNDTLRLSEYLVDSLYATGTVPK